MDNNYIYDILCQDSGSEYVILAALVSMSIGHNLTAYEQNLVGNFLQVVGQNLCVLSIKKSSCVTNLKDLTNSEKENSINNNITNNVSRKRTTQQIIE